MAVIFAVMMLDCY